MPAGSWDIIGRTEQLPKLREELRDAIRTLSNARRGEVWEIVNKMLALYDTTFQGPGPKG